MPCSSSETGAGSSWESCCTALTAFFSPPPAASTRPEALRNDGNRNYTGGTRPTIRRLDSSNHALMPSFGSSSEVVSSSTTAEAAIANPIFSRGSFAGRAGPEISEIFNNNTTFVSANRPEQSFDTNIPETRNRSRVASARAEMTAVVRPVSAPLVDEDMQGEHPCYLSTTSAAPAGASSTADLRSGSAFSVYLPASISAFSAVTQAPAQAAATVSGAAGAAREVRAPGAQGLCNFEPTATNWTPWRSSKTTVRGNSVWDDAREDGTSLPGASAAVFRSEHSPPRPCAELRFSKGEKQLASTASQHSTRPPHLSTAALMHIPCLRRGEKRIALGEGSVAAATPAEVGAKVHLGGRAVASLPTPHKNCGNTAGPPITNTFEPNADECAILRASSTSKPNTRTTSIGRGHGKAATVADDSTAAGVASASIGAAAGGTSLDTEEELGHTSARQVVFYSPDGSPVKEEPEPHTPVLLPFSGLQQDPIAYVPHHGMPFALQPQSRQALGQWGGEGSTPCPERPALVQKLAESAYGSAKLYRQGLYAVASTAKAHWTESGGGIQEQGSVIAGQPASVSMSERISCGSTVRTPSPRPRGDACRTAGDCVRDDGRLSRGAAPTMEVQQLGRSSLTEPRSHAPDGGRDCAGILERMVATEAMETMHLDEARRTPVRVEMSLGCEPPVAATAATLEATVKKEHMGITRASSSTQDAIQLTQKDRTSLSGSCLPFEVRKRVGQRSLRQRLFDGGAEDCDDWLGNLLMGDRTCAARRGRCQRPASWKRVRQTIEGGQSTYRGCDLIYPSAAVGVTGQVDWKEVEHQHKRNVQRGGGKQGVPTAPESVRDGKRAIRTYESKIADDTLCSTTVSGLHLMKRSHLQKKNNTWGEDRLFDRSDAETGSTAYGARPPVTAFATESVAFDSKEAAGLGDYPSQQMIPVKGGVPSQADRPLVRGPRQRDMNRCDERSSGSAATAVHSDQQSSSVKNSAPTKMPPLNSGEQYFMYKGTWESHGDTGEGGGDDCGLPVAESERMSVIPSDEAKEETGGLVTKGLILNCSDASASCKALTRSDASAGGGSVHSGSVGATVGKETNRTEEEDSRRRSIGPRDLHRFDDDASGDEGKVAAEEAGNSISWQLSSRTLSRQPQHQERTRESSRTVSTPAVCARPPDLSVRSHALWPSPYDYSPEDVDEDEASRFFKRRRCSLLLWGGIRHDRGHVAGQRAPRDAPTRARAPTDGCDSTGGRDETGVGESTANILQEEYVERRQVALETMPIDAAQRRCNQTRLEQQPSGDERPAEGSPGDEGVVREPLTGPSGPTLGSTLELATSLAGVSALFPSRLTRKRKRGVGACRTRLLLLQPRGAGVSKEDATLVDSLGSALTYEETQQLRRREEQRRQEVLRRQDEARRKEEAVAVRLKVEQKDAAATIAAMSTTPLSSSGFVFGSAKPAPAGTSGVPATSAGPPATLVQEAGRTGIALERTSTATASTDGLIAVSGAKDAADGIEGLEATQWPVTTDVHRTGQATDEPQQTKEAFQTGRPKLRIIRSPPSAGDYTIPGVSGGAAEPCDAGVAANSSLQAISRERKPHVGQPFFQGGRLAEAFGNAAEDLRPLQADGFVPTTPQLQMSGGMLPPEFGGVSLASGISGTATTASAAVGNANAFSATTVATGTATDADSEACVYDSRARTLSAVHHRCHRTAPDCSSVALHFGEAKTMHEEGESLSAVLPYNKNRVEAQAGVEDVHGATSPLPGRVADVIATVHDLPERGPTGFRETQPVTEKGTFAEVYSSRILVSTPTRWRSWVSVAVPPESGCALASRLGLSDTAATSKTPTRRGTLAATGAACRETDMSLAGQVKRPSLLRTETYRFPRDKRVSVRTPSVAGTTPGRGTRHEIASTTETYKGPRCCHWGPLLMQRGEAINDRTPAGEPPTADPKLIDVATVGRQHTSRKKGGFIAIGDAAPPESAKNSFSLKPRTIVDRLTASPVRLSRLTRRTGSLPVALSVHKSFSTAALLSSKRKATVGAAGGVAEHTTDPTTYSRLPPEVWVYESLECRPLSAVDEDNDAYTQQRSLFHGYRSVGAGDSQSRTSAELRTRTRQWRSCSLVEKRLAFPLENPDGHQQADFLCCCIPTLLEVNNVPTLFSLRHSTTAVDSSTRAYSRQASTSANSSDTTTAQTPCPPAERSVGWKPNLLPNGKHEGSRRVTVSEASPGAGGVANVRAGASSIQPDTLDETPPTDGLSKGLQAAHDAHVSSEWWAGLMNVVDVTLSELRRQLETFAPFHAKCLDVIHRLVVDYADMHQQMRTRQLTQLHTSLLEAHAEHAALRKETASLRHKVGTLESKAHEAGELRRMLDIHSHLFSLQEMEVLNAQQMEEEARRADFQWHQLSEVVEAAKLGKDRSFLSDVWTSSSEGGREDSGSAQQFHQSLSAVLPTVVTLVPHETIVKGTLDSSAYARLLRIYIPPGRWNLGIAVTCSQPLDITLLLLLAGNHTKFTETKEDPLSKGSSGQVATGPSTEDVPSDVHPGLKPFVSSQEDKGSSEQMATGPGTEDVPRTIHPKLETPFSPQRARLHSNSLCMPSSAASSRESHTASKSHPRKASHRCLEEANGPDFYTEALRIAAFSSFRISPKQPQILQVATPAAGAPNGGWLLLRLKGSYGTKKNLARKVGEARRISVVESGTSGMVRCTPAPSLNASLLSVLADRTTEDKELQRGGAECNPTHKQQGGDIEGCQDNVGGSRERATNSTVDSSENSRKKQGMSPEMAQNHSELAAAPCTNEELRFSLTVHSVFLHKSVRSREKCGCTDDEQLKEGKRSICQLQRTGFLTEETVTSLNGNRSSTFVTCAHVSPSTRPEDTINTYGRARSQYSWPPRLISKQDANTQTLSSKLLRGFVRRLHEGPRPPPIPQFCVCESGVLEPDTLVIEQQPRSADRQMNGCVTAFPSSKAIHLLTPPHSEMISRQQNALGQASSTSAEPAGKLTGGSSVNTISLGAAERSIHASGNAQEARTYDYYYAPPYPILKLLLDEMPIALGDFTTILHQNHALRDAAGVATAFTGINFTRWPPRLLAETVWIILLQHTRVRVRREVRRPKLQQHRLHATSFHTNGDLPVSTTLRASRGLADGALLSAHRPVADIELQGVAAGKLNSSDGSESHAASESGAEKYDSSHLSPASPRQGENVGEALNDTSAHSLAAFTFEYFLGKLDVAILAHSVLRSFLLSILYWAPVLEAISQQPQESGGAVNLHRPLRFSGSIGAEMRKKTAEEDNTLGINDSSRGGKFSAETVQEQEAKLLTSKSRGFTPWFAVRLFARITDLLSSPRDSQLLRGSLDDFVRLALQATLDELTAISSPREKRNRNYFKPDAAGELNRGSAPCDAALSSLPDNTAVLGRRSSAASHFFRSHDRLCFPHIPPALLRVPTELCLAVTHRAAARIGMRIFSEEGTSEYRTAVLRAIGDSKETALASITLSKGISRWAQADGTASSFVGPEETVGRRPYQGRTGVVHNASCRQNVPRKGGRPDLSSGRDGDGELSTCGPPEKERSSPCCVDPESSNDAAWELPMSVDLLLQILTQQWEVLYVHLQQAMELMLDETQRAYSSTFARQVTNAADARLRTATRELFVYGGQTAKSGLQTFFLITSLVGYTSLTCCGQDANLFAPLTSLNAFSSFIRRLNAGGASAPEEVLKLYCKALSATSSRLQPFCSPLGSNALSTILLYRSRLTEFPLPFPPSPFLRLAPQTEVLETLAVHRSADACSVVHTDTKVPPLGSTHTRCSQPPADCFRIAALASPASFADPQISSASHEFRLASFIVDGLLTFVQSRGVMCVKTHAEQRSQYARDIMIDSAGGRASIWEGKLFVGRTGSLLQQTNRIEQILSSKRLSPQSARATANVRDSVPSTKQSAVSFASLGSSCTPDGQLSTGMKEESATDVHALETVRHSAQIRPPVRAGEGTRRKVGTDGFCNRNNDGFQSDCCEQKRAGGQDLHVYVEGCSFFGGPTSTGTVATAPGSSRGSHVENIQPIWPASGKNGFPTSTALGQCNSSPRARPLHRQQDADSCWRNDGTQVSHCTRRLGPGSSFSYLDVVLERRIALEIAREIETSALIEVRNIAGVPAGPLLERLQLFLKALLQVFGRSDLPSTSAEELSTEQHQCSTALPNHVHLIRSLEGFRPSRGRLSSPMQNDVADAQVLSSDDVETAQTILQCVWNAIFKLSALMAEEREQKRTLEHLVALQRVQCHAAGKEALRELARIYRDQVDRLLIMSVGSEGVSAIMEQPELREQLLQMHQSVFNLEQQQLRLQQAFTCAAGAAGAGNLQHSDERCKEEQVAKGSVMGADAAGIEVQQAVE